MSDERQVQDIEAVAFARAEACRDVVGLLEEQVRFLEGERGHWWNAYHSANGLFVAAEARASRYETAIRDHLTEFEGTRYESWFRVELNALRAALAAPLVAEAGTPAGEKE